MPSHRFSQLDVFTEKPLLGNPLAVVHDADALSSEQMQAFARWTNLSETTFLLAPTDPAADYRVRIFTPGGELMFAGHPTLGSCKAWLLAGGTPRTPGRVVQQCGVGLVALRSEGEQLAFQAPPCRIQALDAAEQSAVQRALGLSADAVELAASLDNGTRWVALLLRDADSVLRLEPDHAALRQLPKVGAVGFYPKGSPCLLELRAFATCNGIPEDPVTGSLNASVAQWLLELGRVPERYVASQGTRLLRQGRVHVARTEGGVWVGGDVAVCIQGSVQL